MARQEHHNLKPDSLLPSPLAHQAATDLRVSVMITTHNRVNELKQTCEVLESLSPPLDEVLLCAEGCRDNTVELIQHNYQHYRFFINPVSRGSVASRYYLIRQAEGDLVLVEYVAQMSFSLCAGTFPISVL
ncbi:glycosyltransferase [Coleofasciculus sp. G2-EDA-02]|uniref:glycosyltransferase n=1 Tax=Coleofasciculus sp. G2-EDA-02 TaxID=3069529 RepID=UPI003300C1D8